MKAFAIILNPLSGQTHDTVIALNELSQHTYAEDCLLIYSLNPVLFAPLDKQVKLIWPVNINVWPHPQQFVLMGQLILRLGAEDNTYAIGEETSAEEYFRQLGIHVSKLPLE